MKEENKNTDAHNERDTQKPVEPLHNEKAIDLKQEAEDHTTKDSSSIINSGLRINEEEENYRESQLDAEPVEAVPATKKIELAEEKEKLKGLDKAELDKKLKYYEQLLDKGLLNEQEFEMLQKEIKQQS